MSDDATPVHLILGGSGGIGAALARRLAERGARLVLAARDPAQGWITGQVLGVDGGLADLGAR